MFSEARTAQLAPSAQRNRSGAEKAVLLLLAIGKPRVTDILRRFDPDELKIITRSADRISGASPEELANVVAEFEYLFSNGTKVFATSEEVRTLLSDVMSDEEIQAVLAKRERPYTPFWPLLPNVADEALKTYLAGEHPQVAAFVLTRMDGDRAAELLKQFSAEMRNDLFCRMLGMRPVAAEVGEALETAMHECLIDESSTHGTGPSGPHLTIAGILNTFDNELSEQSLSSIAAVRPKDAPVIRKLLFKFEDLITLAPKALTTLMDGLPVERVVVALQGMDAEFQGKILATLAPRARRMAESELQGGVAAAPKDLVQARRAIVETVLKLSAEGAIELPNAGAVA